METENPLFFINENIRKLSLSDREIVLPFPQVIEALIELKAQRIGFLGWEGWAKYDEFYKGHFGDFVTGSFDWKKDEKWDTYVDRGFDFCKETIEVSFNKWKAKFPPWPELYFCLSVASKDCYLELRSNR